MAVFTKSIEYARLYFEEGLTMKQIADIYGVYTSTVSRCIHHVEQRRCPFAADCLNCPLKECAFKEEWQGIINATTYGRGRRKNAND